MFHDSLIARVLAVLIAFVVSTAAHGAISRKSNCDSGDKAYVYVVLLDVSDPFFGPEALAFEKLVDRILDEVPDRGRLDIYSIDPAFKIFDKPELSVCKPESADKLGFSIGTKHAEKLREKTFIVPARMLLLKHSKDLRGTNISPIVESIFNISLRSFLDKSSRDTMGKLVIISDFLQHSDVLSFLSVFKPAPPYAEWKKTSNGRQLIRSFPHVSVEAVVLHRAKDSKFQNTQWRDFWVNYLKDNFRCVRWADMNKSITQGSNDGCN